MLFRSEKSTFVTKETFEKCLKDKDWSDEHSEIQLCREAFKENYTRYWIDTCRAEAANRANEFKEFEVKLYPKSISLRKELQRMNLRPPRLFNLSFPKRLLRKEEEEEDLQKKETRQQTEKRHVHELFYQKKYFQLKELNKLQWEEYRNICYRLIHDDINKQKVNKTQCITVNVKVNNDTKKDKIHVIYKSKL